MSFDEEARTWDQNPGRLERARLFAAAILNHVPEKFRKKALEFGCGTGLTSEQMADDFDHITLVDTSKGMMAVLREKIERNRWTHFHPLEINLLEESIAENDFDVIYTGMTLHHIHNTGKILRIFNNLLKPGGFLCILDLVTEDGSFHSNPDFDGHKGYDHEELKKELKKAGFRETDYRIATVIRKEVNEGEKDFPLFISIAQKITAS